MPSGETNQYSPLWFSCFHAGIPAERTRKETDFLVKHLPRPGFQKIADVCCGMGRHTRALSDLGYDVNGVERDAAAISHARKAGGGGHYEQADMREWRPASGSYDAVIVMSQSFGYFDTNDNFAVLGQLARALRPGGRLVLDLWDPEFFVARQGERDLPMPMGIVRETKQVTGGRLGVRLDYPSGDRESFSWQLFAPEQLSVFAAPAGLKTAGRFAGFTEVPPDGSVPGWQALLQKAGQES